MTTHDEPVTLAQAPARAMTMIEAINDALDIMLAHDPAVIVLGEDVGYFGGVFRATAGLQKKYGKTRVFDTPINECGIIGVAVGMGAYGLRPVPEIQFADYIYPGLDQLVSEAARLRYRSAGEFIAPMTVRSPFGGGIFGGQTHSQSPEAMFTHVCGIKTVVPSTPHDAKGLLIAAIEDNDPVVFFEPKRVYRAAKGDVPDGDFTVPLESAAITRSGRHVTVLAYGAMLYEALDAANKAAEKGVEAEVIDLRTLWPVDIATILESVKRTGRLVVVHEAPRTLGFAAELISLVVERAFYHLEAAPVRVTGFDTPFPYALEMEYMPLSHRILPALLDVARG